MNDGGITSGLLRDGDTMLILALAYLLYRQNADKSLIIALLSVALI